MIFIKGSELFQVKWTKYNIILEKDTLSQADVALNGHYIILQNDHYNNIILLWLKVAYNLLFISHKFKQIFLHRASFN